MSIICLYIYTCNIHLCYFCCLLAKSTKFQPLKIKNAPGSFLEQEKCPWKIIPESDLSSFIPSCDSNATTVGYCLCLLLAPNQPLKSLHDMPVWDEQVARMVWKRAKLLKTRKPKKPKTGEAGGMVPVSTKNQNRISQFNYVCCVRPCFVTSMIPEKPRMAKLKIMVFTITANYAFFPANYAFYPANYAS